MTRSLVPMIFGQFVQLKKGKNSHGIMRQPNGNFVPPLTAIVAAQIVEGKFVDSRTVGTPSWALPLGPWRRGRACGMPGPGGANAASGGTKEQVLVAALPGAGLDVHIARLDVAAGKLTLREASVAGGGNVSLGDGQVVALANAERVEARDKVVEVFGPGNQSLVQMHMETAEDERSWAEALRAAIGREGGSQASPSRGDGRTAASPLSQGEGPEEAEVTALRARSTQLESRIQSLEAIGDRRDGQLEKMLRRLEGAMQMLTAVQDMCDQQRRVIGAQRVAITELRRERGLDDEEEDEQEKADEEEEDEDEEVKATMSKHFQGDAHCQGRENGVPSGAGMAAEEREEEGEGDGEDMHVQSMQMLALLQQADKMQRALESLQAAGVRAGVSGTPQAQSAPPTPASSSRPAETVAPAAFSVPPSPSVGATFRPVMMTGPAPKASPATQPSASADSESAETEAALDRLRSLEAEKSRFEGMLRDSQQEHEELLQRLNGMRALMSSLGMQEEDDDEASDQSGE